MSDKKSLRNSFFSFGDHYKRFRNKSNANDY